jgi:hypothetical protein
MSSKRRSYEAGHKRKYLVVIDDTEECDRAVFWAAKRAGRTKSQMVMLRVIEPGDRNQQWLGVADIMKAEQMEAANKTLDKFAARAKRIAHVAPDRVIREGDAAEEGRPRPTNRQHRQDVRHLPDSRGHRARPSQRRRPRGDGVASTVIPGPRMTDESLVHAD